MEKGTKRRLRFPPSIGTLAWIDPVLRDTREEFQPLLPALVVDESHTGCGLVILYRDNIMEGETCMVQVAELEPLPALIRWINHLDEDVLKVGMAYLDDNV